MEGTRNERGKVIKRWGGKKTVRGKAEKKEKER
jgi:hypothetical protein